MTQRDDLTLALALADEADAVTTARYRASDLVVETKPDLTPVTEADRGVEERLRAILADERPVDGVLGEEFGGHDQHDRVWIIDPIDGTKNFVRGVPVWATLIGLMVGGVVSVGVVSAPALGRRWWAQSGHGAWVRGDKDTAPQRMAVSQVRSIADASFSYSDAVGWSPDTLSAMLAATWRQRAYGDFWSHMLIAEGAVDVAAEPNLEIYDMAALLPIIQEAGGRVTGFAGQDPLSEGSLLSTNGALHDHALAILQS